MRQFLTVVTYMALSLGLFTSTTYALEAEVLIRGIQEATSATGIIITSDGTQKRAPTSFEQVGASTVAVRFAYSAQDIQNGALASAIATNANGETAFATVTELRAQETKPASLHLSQCSTTATNSSANTQQIVLFERLVELRKKRREVKIQELQGLLTEDIAAKLSKLESHFGYEYQTPLSGNMNPVVLSQRLDQLVHSIKTFNLHRKSK